MKIMQVRAFWALIIHIIDTYQVNIIENSITVNKPDDVVIKNGGIKKFFFSEVFEPDTTQEDIMKQTCLPLIEDLFNNSSFMIIYIISSL